MTKIPATSISTVYQGTSGLTIMGLAGFAGDPNIVYCLSPDGSYIELHSAFAFALDRNDTVVTVGHPLPGRLDEYVAWVVDMITGPTILVGLSTGGQLAEKIFQAAAAAGKLKYLYPVLGSTPDTAARLQPALSRLIPILARVPNWFGIPLVRYPFFPSFIHPGAYYRLLRSGRRWIIPLIWKSVRRSVWMFDAIRLLNASTGFGPEIISDARVATLNLRETSLDKVLDIHAAVAAARKVYPNLDERTYNGTEHGVYEIDGPEVSEALRQIRAIAAPLLGVSA